MLMQGQELPKVLSIEVPLERQTGSEWRRAGLAGARKREMESQMGMGNK